MGAVPSPFECYMAIRSIKTLKLRVEAICKKGRVVADYLNTHNLVEKVIYPGLKSHP
jgi:cystathionine beta-lyase/cystathionine gamma-synthase